MRNRDRWVVTAINDDGAMTVRPADGIDQVVLASDYVAEHVELGYASTAYGAQGVTADTAHAFVSTAMTGEVLYVAATRGRDENRLYVDVCPQPSQPEIAHGRPDSLDVRDVLLAVVDRRGGDLSAHQTIRNEWSSASSFERLAQEHHTLVAAATADRWDAVLETCGLDPDVLAKARRSVEWAGLLGALRDADNRGLNVEAAMPEIVRGGTIGGEKDPAVVLRARLHRWEHAVSGRWRSRMDMVAGLVPRMEGILDYDMAKAIRKREEAIGGRARSLAEEALEARLAWVRPFGPPPAKPLVRAAFVERLAIIAAYRDRWGIDGGIILGPERDVGSVQQVAHRNRARRAGQAAALLAGTAPEPVVPVDSSPPDEVSLGPTP